MLVLRVQGDVAQADHPCLLPLPPFPVFPVGGRSARDDAGRGGGDVSARVLALQRELDIKASAIINLNAEIATARAVAADLEEQLR